MTERIAPPQRGGLVPELAIKDKTAIAGIGWTRFSRDSGTTVLNLGAEAALKAAEDAGISVKDIDGIVVYRYWPDSPGPDDFADALELEFCNYELFCELGGGWACSAPLTGASTPRPALATSPQRTWRDSGRRPSILRTSPSRSGSMLL